MPNNDIKDIFQSKYSTANWKQLLSALFPGQGLNLKPLDKKDESLKKHEDANTILELGVLDVPFDGTRKAKIAIYEVQLKKGKAVTRNRVGLRNILQHEVVPGDVDAVLASFYSEGSRDWRLTLISKSVSWDFENNKEEWETQPKRYTYVLGETETVTTATQRFEWLLKQREGSAWLLDILKAFSVERISSEFFKGYHHLFKSFEEYMVDQTAYFNYFKKFTKEGTEKEKDDETERLIRNFIKKLFGRIVFLYFLQKKGWLGVPKDKAWGEGERNFISKLFEEYGKDPKFYEKVLTVLFFETLNTERKDDLFSITKTKVPFLNGGLFDKDDIEPTDVKISHALFQELFDFFEQYNFTIDENSPEDQDIGIDPEMLGLIFENLLEDNKDKGTFYTPKEVVHYMCKESLSAYLKNALKDKASEKELKRIEAFVMFNDDGTPGEVKKYAADIDLALRTVKICDPAIGSGAFPMGMVYEILRVKKEVFGFLKKQNFNYREEKLAIIKNSIYGVDIDKGAVDIARLRFWLSLIVDEEIPTPLPNLDYRIMQGNSLVESFEGIQLDYIVERNSSYKVTVVDPQANLFDGSMKNSQTQVVYTGEQKEQLDKLVDAYFEPVDTKKKKAIHDSIERIIHENIVSIFEREELILDNKIQEAETAKASIRLDKNDSTAKKKQKQTSLDKFNTKIKALGDDKKKLKQKLKRLEEISTKEEKPYFLWHLFFRDIFNKREGGFDIVIGNPPYGVDVDKSIQELYDLGKRDSYGVFISMALKKLMKPGAHLCYIVSDTWLTISSHFKLRKQILDHHHLQKVIRLHGDCFKATVNSCIMAVEATAANKKHNSAEVHVLAADLTNLSTRKNVAEFRDKLFHLEEYVRTSTPQFAVYAYEQNLTTNTINAPILTGDPKLFRKFFVEESEVTPLSKIIDEVCSGVKTYDNERYIKSLNGIQGYSQIEEKEIYKGPLSKELLEGINSKDCYIPFEKGGESLDGNSELNQIYKQTDFFIKWNTQSVKEINKVHGLRNKYRYFEKGISFSESGFYSPVFRYFPGHLFANSSPIIFLKKEEDIPWVLGVLSSKFIRYILKNFLNHTVHTLLEDIELIPIKNSKSAEIVKLTTSLIDALASNPNRSRLDYINKIDFAVYQLYNLDENQINEVETWFARRYPKLAKYAYIKPKEDLVKAEAKTTSATERIKALIAQEESRNLEFKSSLRYDVKQIGIPPETMEHSVFKNIAAFLNTEGGTILIGVEDNQNIIGLENTDYKTFKGENKKDELLKHFDNLIQNYFGDHVHHNLRIEFATFEGKTVCMIEVLGKAGQPVFLKQKNKNDEFYIRRFASAKALTVMESVNYIKEHWN